MTKTNLQKLFNILTLATLIFISAVTLVSIGILIGSNGQGVPIISDAFNTSVQLGNHISRNQYWVSRLKLFELATAIGFIVTLLLCWTLYLLQQSRRNTRSIILSNRALKQEIDKRQETKNILDEVNEELSRSNSRLTGVIEGTTDLISAIDTEYKITCYNEAYRKEAMQLFGRDVGIGINLIEAQKDSPEEQAKSKQLWDRALAGEQFNAYEEIIDENEVLHAYETTYNPVRDAQGKIIGASHIIRNVTERKHAEEALKRERDFVSTVVEASNLLVMVTDLEGRIVKFNHACEITSGYLFEEIKGRVFWNVLLSPEEAASIKLGHRNIGSDMLIQNYVSHWITKDEHARLISWRNSVITDEDGSQFLVATGIDITEKEEFKETQNRILDILETSSDFIGISDMTGGVRYLNPAGKEITGLQRSSDVSSMKMISAYPKWAGELIQREGIPTAIKRGSWIGETALKTQLGREIPVSQLILAHKNEKGEVAYLSTVARDISKQKRLENELSSARDAALETANLKSEFLANMSHEIRTPMNGIIGLAELLMSTELDDEQRDYVRSVQTSGEILLTIVNDILDFSKIEAGKFNMETVSFDLRETLESILDLFAEPAHRQGIEVALLVQNDVPDALFGDPRRLRQVLTNLIANSIKFTEKGEIVIRVKLSSANPDSNSATLHFSVADTGIGVAENVQKYLFDAFTQADNSITRKYGGTGLGLAISKQLVEMMNGEIGVKSKPGEGATFFFTADFETEPGEDFSLSFDDLSDKRILIVDDNDSIRKVLLQQTKWLGAIADEAESGEKAVSILKTASENGDPFDIAVIDLNMPDASGIEVAKRIRKTPQIRNTKILVMPSINDHELIKSSKGKLIDSYLFKPIRQTEYYGHLSDLVKVGSVTAAVRDKKAEIVTARRDKRNVVSASQKTAPQRRSRKRILIAEDNLVNQKVIRNQVERLGYAVDIKHNGEEVLDAVKKENYALILMDCQMPVLDGIEATKKLREIERETGSRVPVVAITAHAIEGDRDRCIEAGMDDYISKPTKREDLENILHRWVEMRLENDGANPGDAEQEVESDESFHIETRLTELAETCGEDVTLECLELFSSDIENSIQRLCDAMKNSDFVNVDQEAHKLKGSASNMGAVQLPHTCMDLMLAVRENRIDQANLLVESLVSQYEAIKPIYKIQQDKYSELVSKLQPTG
ncbi:MAG: response regulator [Pyrinomonadaceae bacterium]